MSRVKSPAVAGYLCKPDRGGSSLDDQIERCEAFLQAQQAEGRWPGSRLRYYLDSTAPESGSEGSGIARLMDDVSQYEVSGVICDRFESLSAFPTAAAEYVRYLEMYGVDLVFLDEGVNGPRVTGHALAKLARWIVSAEPLSEATIGGLWLRVATYARDFVADASAAESLRLQHRRAQEYVAAQCRGGNWAVRSHVLYADDGNRGSGVRRPGVRQLRCDVDDGQVDVVICDRLVRIVRTVGLLLDFFELFRSKNVRFIALREGIGIPEGRSRSPVTPDLGVEV